MRNNKITLKEAERFHGHLGPYLVLGLLAGEMALKKLGCRKYFGLNARIWGAVRKPKSCLIDGLQLSAGTTYGKGNIVKLNGSGIKIEFCNSVNHRTVALSLKDNIIRMLDNAESHKESEILAKELYKTKWDNVFNLTTNY
ncbi:MAG: formylmethanofuran dehydrogenase subunit E family protein [Candidatus Omnitrophota bacterium]